MQHRDETVRAPPALVARRRAPALALALGLTTLGPAACQEPEIEVKAPDPCALLSAKAPGPLAEERAKTADPLALAKLFVREAHQTADPGFYTLAEAATTCALSRKPEDLDARRTRAFVWYQFHRFKDVEGEARALLAAGGTPEDQMLLGDALMEQGRLDEAANAYQEVVNKTGGLEIYVRVGWLRWLWGDLDGAIQMDQLALQAAGGVDTDALAFALTDLGWLRALRGEPGDEIEQALRLDPANTRAHLLRGRLRLHHGDRAGATADADAAGETWEAARLQHELRPEFSLANACSRDPRGCACWEAEDQPQVALKALDQELTGRQDAMTKMCHAYARFKLGQDAEDEARAALASGTRDPNIQLLGGLILGDPGPLRAALDLGPGLLPSERARAEAALSAQGAAP